jgi:hypothetical protein
MCELIPNGKGFVECDNDLNSYEVCKIYFSTNTYGCICMYRYGDVYINMCILNPDGKNFVECDNDLNSYEVCLHTRIYMYVEIYINIMVCVYYEEFFY